MSSCGCSGGQSTPPDSTPSSSSLPSGVGNSYGSTTSIPSSCAPSTCPTPPVNNEVGMEPYCPSWMEKILSATSGKLLLKVGTCLHFLRSKCSGVVWYDRATESVTVRDAPFVGNAPKQVTYGFLAKVLPKRRVICSDALEDCPQEAVQELAAQPMGQSSFGDLVVAVNPLCGELPQDESADADKQVALHALTPGDAPCSATGVKFLIRMDGTRGSGSAAVQGSRWGWLNRLRLRRTQWGQAVSGSADEASSFIMVGVPVAGGTTEDPCIELRVSEVKPGSGLPSTANNCEKLIFKNKGTPLAGWYAVPPGVSFYGISAPTLIISYGGLTANIPVTLPEYPTDACGEVWAVFQTSGQAFSGPSASSTQIALSLNGYSLFSVGYFGSLNTAQAQAKVTSALSTLNFTATGSGSRLVNVYLIGYLK